MSKKQIQELIKKGKMPKVTDYKFKDFKMILSAYGYHQDRISNSVHAKFVNPEKNHSVVVSGIGRNVEFPIAQKILKEIHSVCVL